MNYWDSSALVTLFVEQPGSAASFSSGNLSVRILTDGSVVQVKTSIKVSVWLPPVEIAVFG